MGFAQTQIADGSSPLAPARINRPGWGSWLALLLIGVFGLAWTRNEYVIAWLLDNKVFDESASRTLPAALTYAYVAAAAVALAIAWRVVAWPVLRVYAGAPGRVPVPPTARLLGVPARAAGRVCAAGALARGVELRWLAGREPASTPSTGKG